MIAKLSRCLGLAAALTLSSPEGDRALADRISDASGEISIESAALLPAPKGAYADLLFTMENGGATTVRVVKVTTELGEPGEFDVNAGSGSVHSDGFSLGAAEKVSFSDKGGRLRTGPLKRDLREGDVVKLTFTFDRSSATVPVHVHKEALAAEGREDRKP